MISVNKMVAITPLHENPDYAPILAFWAYQEWYKDRSLAFDIVLKAYLDRTIDGHLPQTYVALADTLPVGMVTLKLDDLWSRKDLNPWLSSLYVVPEFRNRGVGWDLIGVVINKSAEIGYDCLYLFLGSRETARLESYYVTRGWQMFDHSMDNDGRSTKILRYKPAILTERFSP
jgi:GNAT superfamily N-acetyltransferase